MDGSPHELRQLAEFHGVQTAYYDLSGVQHHASPEALLALLRALGAPLNSAADAPDALRSSRQSRWQQWLEPVNLAWDGRSTAVPVRLRAEQGGPVLVRLQHEDGSERRLDIRAEEWPVVAEEWVEGVHYVLRHFTLDGPIPLGYHQLHLELGAAQASSTLIAAPERAFEPSPGPGRHTSWGVFLPLYALHTARSWGAGDFADLRSLIDWVSERGGGMVATLPLLAAFLDEPFEPGPYSPASRLFWNEFYIDLEAVPELAHCPSALARLQSADFQREIQALRAAPQVDYQRQMALKRSLLEELAQSFFAHPGNRQSAFDRFLAERPLAEAYAEFRAVGERRKAPWPAWPAPLRDGKMTPGDYDEAAKRYHLYVQWLADDQLQALAQHARAKGPGLYLDLPLGVNPDSFDVWRERDAFATGIAAGAPPDPFFAKGQNWGFPPLHPQRIREQGFRHVRDYVRHHLRLAGVLRIDHMMGFHRLFWIPHGMGANQGVYVSYPSEELYAVFSLESHRHRSLLVGEDLGTVPPEVRPAMERHAVHRMYVMQYELQPQYQNALTAVYPGSVASLNTHDMPPFMAFWQGSDIQDRVALGILDANVANDELQRRRSTVEALIRSLRLEGWLGDPAEPLDVLRASLLHMAAGNAFTALTNLEDLWLETQPQNMPGTWRERPNWRLRARYSLEQISSLPHVAEILQALDRVTRTGRA